MVHSSRQSCMYINHMSGQISSGQVMCGLFGSLESLSGTSFRWCIAPVNHVCTGKINHMSGQISSAHVMCDLFGSLKPLSGTSFMMVHNPRQSCMHINHMSGQVSSGRVMCGLFGSLESLSGTSFIEAEPALFFLSFKVIYSTNQRSLSFRAERTISSFQATFCNELSLQREIRQVWFFVSCIGKNELSGILQKNRLKRRFLIRYLLKAVHGQSFSASLHRSVECAGRLLPAIFQKLHRKCGKPVRDRKRLREQRLQLLSPEEP